VFALVQRRQQDLRRYGLVPVGDEGGEPVVVNGDTPVGVLYEDGKLHGGRHERWGGGVEAVDGGSDHREAGLVRTVDKPEHKKSDTR